MNKYKSRTLRLRRFVHRYGIIYGNNRNEFGNKICSRELAPATTTHFPLFVAPLSVILTKFYDEQKPSCLPRRHLIHPVVWLLDTLWTLGWWLSQNNLDTASHEPLTRAGNEPPANLECHAIFGRWPIRGKCLHHWPIRSQLNAGGIQHLLSGSDQRKWVNCQTGLNLHQMDHDHHECGDSIKSESGLRSCWYKCKPSRIGIGLGLKCLHPPVLIMISGAGQSVICWRVFPNKWYLLRLTDNAGGPTQIYHE